MSSISYSAIFQLIGYHFLKPISNLNMDLKNNRFKKLGMIIFSAEIWKASKRC